jgi:hypothetical protein
MLVDTRQVQRRYARAPQQPRTYRPAHPCGG